MGGTSALEVAGLFAVAAFICWPTLRRQLAELRRRNTVAAPPVDRRRGEPRRAVDETLADELLYDEAPSWRPYEERREPRPAQTSAAAASPRSGRPGCDRDAVLPLAEAFRRGEQLSSMWPNDTTGRKAAIPDPASAPAPRDDQPFKVLLVDGRDKFRTAMLLRLARAGHRVFPVARPQEALDVFARELSDLVLIHRDALRDLGEAFAQRIRSSAAHVPILVHGLERGAAPSESGQRPGVTLLIGAGDDLDIIAGMVDCSLNAARAIRQVRDDQLARGEVLSEVCFNLRSSLDVISGYTEILSDSPDLSEHRDLLARVLASASAATQQMQTCAAVAGDAPDSARQERVDLLTLSQKVERMVSRQMGRRRLRLTTSGPVQGSAIFTDGEKLLSILSHVVSDAIRLTDSTDINISVRALPDRTDFVVGTADRSAAIGLTMPGEWPAAGAATDPTHGTTAAAGLSVAERLGRSIGATLTGRSGGAGAPSFTVSVPGKLMTQAAGRTLH